MGVEVAWLARFFYLFVAFMIMDGKLQPAFALRGEPTQPLWPVDLLNALFGTDWVARVGAEAMWAVHIGGSLLGVLAAIFPGRLAWRLGVFLYLFLFVALWNSYGAIGHGLHFYVYVGFAWLFLPRAVGRRRRMSRQNAMQCLMALWYAQLLTLLAYSLSGFWKIWVSGFALLAPDGFVRILLHRVMSDTLPVPLLVPLLAKNELFAQFLLLCVVYVQTFAILALFRPHLHRPLGIALIGFHMGTHWLLNITFYDFVVVLGLLLVFSPLAPRWSPMGVLQSLPLVGWPLRGDGWPRRPAPRAAMAWLVYDGQCPLCRRYATAVDVRRLGRDLVLVDARAGGPLVEEVKALPHDLNEGMVLKVGGRFYRGADALNVVALLASRRRAFGLVNGALFRSPTIARIAYPLLKLGRRLLLKAKGVPPIE